MLSVMSSHDSAVLLKLLWNSFVGLGQDRCGDRERKFWRHRVTGKLSDKEYDKLLDVIDGLRKEAVEAQK